MKVRRLLIANRGEIAIRVARTAAGLEIATVAVFPEDDACSLHTHRAGEVRRLSGRASAAYLDIAQIVAVARDAACDTVHPGYGFLSENASFARACADAGLTFIGPLPEVLELFGSKTAARTLARECNVPVADGADAAMLAEAHVFLERHGAAMVKAVAGGGGRGMRIAATPFELDATWARCTADAQATFGSGALYL
jgi:pyruvate carboxylase